MQMVTAQRAVNAIKLGATKPYYVICDDGEQYAVKFKENCLSKRVLAYWKGGN